MSGSALLSRERELLERAPAPAPSTHPPHPLHALERSLSGSALQCPHSGGNIKGVTGRGREMGAHDCIMAPKSVALWCRACFGGGLAL
jgi:hypothetical protein